MNRIIEDVRSRLRRHRYVPLRQVLQKAIGYVVGTLRARRLLGDCNSVGPGARVTGRPRVLNEGAISIGKNLILMSTWNPVELVTEPNGRIEIGNGVAINFGTSIRAQQLIRIEDDAMIGQYCILADTEFPEVVSGTEGSRQAPNPAKPILIGKGAWLAGRVTVLPGVTIGEGSVVTAGSVVETDIPAGVLAGGIPARVVRKLGATIAAETPVIAASAVEALRPAVEQRGIVLADFTADELARRLDDDRERPGLQVETGFYGQVTQTLMQGIPADRFDFAVIWTRPESVLPSFARLLAFERVDVQVLLAEVDAFCRLVASGCSQLKAAFVPSWTLAPWQRGLGMLDGRPDGASHALVAANQRLLEGLRDARNIYPLNLQRWIDAAGAGAHSPKGWYLGKVPFGTSVFVEAAREVKAALRGLSGLARKLLVVDLDDTLWGGIVGDVGWQGLRLGGHDGAGEAYADFQRGLKALARRGIVLGIVSKNEESVALEAIEKHPEMVLRGADFVGHRINWHDKARNVADLAAALNLGLQSVVFIDDNPVERARVREALPEVLVPDWPADPLLYPSALTSLRCFDAPILSAEDSARTRLYAEEKQREHLRAQVGDIDEWLKTLGIRVRVEPLGPANLSRATQLLNKTNQMNLTTRRLTEQELSTWVAAPNRALFTLGVSDRFGDAGLTGIVSVERGGDRAQIVDFVLSCRVMGRKIENAMLHLAVQEARALGAPLLEARLVPTAKNKPCREVLQRSGLEQPQDDVFVWDTSRPYELPEVVKLERSA